MTRRRGPYQRAAGCPQWFVVPVIGTGVSAAAGMAVLLLGVLLVVLSAFYESARGEVQRGGCQISFGGKP